MAKAKINRWDYWVLGIACGGGAGMAIIMVIDMSLSTITVKESPDGSTHMTTIVSHESRSPLFVIPLIGAVAGFAWAELAWMRRPRDPEKPPESHAAS